MDGAGLGNTFSMPRQSFGATANVSADVGSSMGGSFGFPSSSLLFLHVFFDVPIPIRGGVLASSLDMLPGLASLVTPLVRRAMALGARHAPPAGRTLACCSAAASPAKRERG